MNSRDSVRRKSLYATMEVYRYLGMNQLSIFLCKMHMVGGVGVCSSLEIFRNLNPLRSLLRPFSAE